VNFGRVYCDFLVYIFYSSIFWDTRWWIKSKSTIRSILAHEINGMPKKPTSNYLTAWSSILLEKIIVSQPVKILPALWNPKVHYHVCKSLLLAPILSHMNPLHNFPSYIPKIHFNIILPFTPRSSEWCLHFRYSDHNLLCI